MRRLLILLLLTGCAGRDPLPCDPAATPQPSRATIGCAQEWAAQAARPLDSSLPGARTVKTIVDRLDGAVYFIDTTTYPFHQGFATSHLGYPATAPFVNEYFVPQRRFLLGSITHYEEADVWAYELAPYDTATAEMIADAHRRLSAASYFGDHLRFHPTSVEQEARVPAGVPVVTTGELFAGMTYQPLNLAETFGQVRVLTAAELATVYVGPREIAVLDRVPNDISIVAGIVTESFQTPLSHVNVLSQQRGTPNMALVDARAHFAGYEGQWVHLTVGAFEWSVEPATQAEADAWWELHRPPPAEVPAPDLTRTGLLDVDGLGVADVGAVGGKAANFGELRHIEGIIVPDGFAIPLGYYARFADENGFTEEIATMLADERFRADGVYRRERLAALQAAMRAAPLPAELVQLLDERLAGEFPGLRMKFRSSTNAEDLERHTGAGLYDSQSGQPGDLERPVADAVRTVWASLWNVRAFEERDHAGIDHLRVAMGVLVHPSYRDELANGVAITANPFDPGPGGEDAFFLNLQAGEVSVVSPDPSVVCDSLLYYHLHLGQPAAYLTHSSLVADGATVLSRAELFDLGETLRRIREHFEGLYDPPAGYARLPMDVELKLVLRDGVRRIEVKQARPYPGRGENP
jgi:pyruvate, water dikinase